MARSAHISFRASSPTLAARLAAADGTTAQRDLERYYQSLDTALREVSLTEPEWNYLRDILRGTFIDTNTARLLWAEVEDAEDEYGAKWGVDPTDLSGRLRTLSPFQCLAIADAIERWWAAQR
jgi:hypothetical protein